MTKEEIERHQHRLVVDGATDLFEQLSPADREVFIKLLLEDEEKPLEDGNLREAVYNIDYAHIPVSPEEFFTNAQYMGHGGAALWDSWWPYLLNASDPLNRFYEVILTGAIGLGKTFVAQLLISYRLYRLLCLRDPAVYYNLAAGSKIVFGVYSLTLDQAMDVGYYILRDQLIGASPFFKDVVPPARATDDEIEFSNHVHVMVGSNVLHSIGQNLFSICVSGDTLVRTTSGHVQISDMVDAPQSVVYFNPQTGSVGISPYPVRSIRSGRKTVYRMTLDNGQSIKLTEDHRFLVRSVLGRYEWRTIRTVMKSDDVVSVPSVG